MKITGTRSYIMVEYDHRTIKINGELTTTPAFYADISSINNWEPPFENLPLSEDEKKKLIEDIIEYSAKEPLKIYFE